MERRIARRQCRFLCRHKSVLGSSYTQKTLPQHLPAEGIFFLILKSWSDLFDYKAAPTIAGDQRDIGLTGIDLDLLTGLRIIVMCNSVLGRLGPGNFDSLTLSNVVTGASGVDGIVDQVAFTQFCKSGILQNNVLESELCIAVSILVCRTILIVIIGSGLFVVLQSRTVVLERKLNGSSADSITSIIKGNFSVCKFEVRSLIVIIVSSGILGICKTLLQTVIGLALLAVGIGIISNILGKLSCLTIVETGETTTEVSGIIFATQSLMK